MAKEIKPHPAKKTKIGTPLTSETLFTALYKGSENQMTRALLQVIQAGGIDLLWYMVTRLTSEEYIPDNYINVLTQQKIYHSKSDIGDPICDGVIETIPFKLLIESKIYSNKVDKNQLQRYMAVVDDSREKGINTFLLYITPDEKRPEVLEQQAKDGCIWKPWTDILAILDSYTKKTPHFEYMMEGLHGLWNKLNDKPLSIPSDKLVAVVAGRIGYPRAIERGIYNCQHGRNFRNAPYLAFYADRAISKVFRIIGEPFKNNGEFPDLPASDDIYRLEPMDEVIQKPLVNTDRDKNGNIKPFTMGVTRYVNLDTLYVAKDIIDLKRLNYKR